jgi:YVTN family beta-propeller protein
MVRASLLGLSVVAVVAAAACGDDDASAPAADGSVGADSGAAPDGGGGAPAIAHAVGTDFESTGVLSRVELPAMTVTANAVAGVASSDPVLRAAGGKLYIVNRFGFDNVTIVDPATDQLVAQISTGNGTNPQDVAVVGDELFVAAFGAPGVIVLDASDPDAEPAVIDLSAHDVDGNPDCNSVYAIGDRVYASLELLDAEFRPRGPGKVVVIDAATHEVTDVLDLERRNPFGLLRDSGDGGLLVATVEFPAPGDEAAGFEGCVERIDDGASPLAEGCVIDNADLGGYATGIAAGDGGVWLSVATSYTEGKVVQLDGEGNVARSITPVTQAASDLARCSTGHLVIADRAPDAPGLRIYDAVGTELTTAPLDIGQPPVPTGGLVCD